MTPISAIHISYGEHPSQFGLLRVPEGANGRVPVVVSIHGGFWQSAYSYEVNEPLAQDLAQRGYATWNIEYRRVGEDGGGWTGTFQDVVDAVNHLATLEEKYELDLGRVVVLGHSAGGHLALWLASRSNKTEQDEIGSPLLVGVNRVISLAGVSDLKKMWELHVEKERADSPVASLIGGPPTEYPERCKLASPSELLPLHIEQILIHGQQDMHVPVELSIEYHRKAIEIGNPVQLVILQQAEHFQVIDPETPAWKAVVQSLGV